jgi:hypothetical protein
LRQAERIVQWKRNAGDGCVIGISHEPKTITQTLIACVGEHLFAGDDCNLPASVMRDVDLPNAGRDHAVRSDNRPVRAKERYDDGHGRKMLLAFISGYLL